MIFKRTMLAALLCVAIAGLAVRADALELAARLDVPSIMKLSEKSGKLADKAQPGSSMKIAMATLALTMNPQLQDFDLTKPFSLLAYIEREAGGDVKWSFAALVSKKGKKAPPEAELGRMQLFVVDFGNAACLCASKRVADGMKEAPGRAGGDAIGKSDLSLSVDMSALRKAGADALLSSFQQMALPTDGALPSSEELDRMKREKVRLEYVDRFLKELSTIDVALSIGDERAKFALSGKPENGSDLEEFIAHQSEAKPLPDACGFDGASAVMAVSLKPDEKLNAQVLGLLRDMAMSGSEDESKVASYSSIVKAVMEASGGGAGAALKLNGKDEEWKFALSCKPDSMQSLEDAFREGGAKMGGSPGLWILHSWGEEADGMKLRCLLDKSGSRAMILLNRSGEDAALKELSSASSVVRIETPQGVCAAVAKAPVGTGAKAEPFGILSFKDGRICLSVEAGYDDVMPSVEGFEKDWSGQ